MGLFKQAKRAVDFNKLAKSLDEDLILLKAYLEHRDKNKANNDQRKK